MFTNAAESNTHFVYGYMTRYWLKLILCSGDEARGISQMSPDPSTWVGSGDKTKLSLWLSGINAEVAYMYLVVHGPIV